MPPNEESQKIASLFGQYVDTGNKKLIENIQKDKIEVALLQYSADKGWKHYNAMERRLEELKEIEKYATERKDKRKELLIGFILGIVSTLICTYLIKLLFQKP